MIYYSQGTIGIFWDYENVPLRNVDYERFLWGLKSYVRANNVRFARIYSREKTMSNQDYELLKSLENFDYKLIEKDEKNAADYSMIQSCEDVLRTRKDIDHVLLITGDGDFLELTDTLHDWNVRITLICQKHNYNKELVRDTHKSYTVSHVASNPQNWWLY